MPRIFFSVLFTREQQRHLRLRCDWLVSIFSITWSKESTILYSMSFTSSFDGDIAHRLRAMDECVWRGYRATSMSVSCDSGPLEPPWLKIDTYEENVFLQNEMSID